jgi:hypothetical protein
MDAAISTISLGRGFRPANLAIILRRSYAIAVTSLVVLAAVLLVSRRLAGALVEPLPVVMLAATGVVAAAAAASVRRLSGRFATRWLLSAAIVLIALALSLPGSSWLGLTVLWLLVVGEEVWTWRSRPIKPKNRIDVAWRHCSQNGSLQDAIQSQTSEDTEPVSVEPPSVKSDEPDWNDTTAMQRLKYARSADGVQSVEGWLRAEFSAGQRTAVVHAAFCPAFSRAPQVESEPLEGPDCEIRPTLTLPWGIRWEVKLSRAAKLPTSVVLGFFANESET